MGLPERSSRITRDQALLLTTEIWAARGTCHRLQVGCIIERGGRILIQGYNGAPPGMPHCPEREHTSEECLAVHAEQNAIAWAARTGVSLENSTLYVTHMPCLACARSIITAGVTSVSYLYEYRDPSGVELLKEAGLKVVHTAIDGPYTSELGFSL